MNYKIFFLLFPNFWVGPKSDSNVAEVILFSNSVSQPLYDTFGKSKNNLGMLYNDTLKEIYPSIAVYSRKDSYYYVSVGGVLKPELYGWITLDNIGINTRQRDSKIVLYSHPNYNSKKEQIHTEDNYLVRVVEIQGTWLKVVYPKKRKKIIKWLPAEYQCPNPYTTCN